MFGVRRPRGPLDLTRTTSHFVRAAGHHVCHVIAYRLCSPGHIVRAVGHAFNHIGDASRGCVKALGHRVPNTRRRIGHALSAPWCGRLAGFGGGRGHAGSGHVEVRGFRRTGTAAAAVNAVQRGTVDVRYYVSRHISLGGAHWFDQYRVNDFALGAQTLTTLAKPSFPMLGNVSRPYTANTLMGRLTYIW
jgi:hypothetical protein